ncbi:legume lectin family protein [Arabidopsis lyrata subsp. lyrata]|uniref:Legume lectin family protein n=1 Tax=Arabidopsis lyrata subsp. lyrata TaxID=81972 RepID=D7L7Q8_ARALL|nr:lectin [Arabidopsis lyrata subsp. lyrata]EFH58861.1 legume lectin family protein [Arabidopsis lyrata subsp. lyrata]|eukprot:XP_020887583.1 lectin [Arabidopsis lyrata subsp. lyrata]
MAMSKTLSFLFLLCFQIHGTMSAAENSSFSFNGFAISPSFDKSVALFGDSKLVNDSSLIQLTDSVTRSVGRVVYKKPINLFQGKQRNSRSFSTHFSFSSMSSEISDGALAFVMVPTSLDLSLFGNKDNSSSALGFLSQYAKNETVFAVEFDISKRGNCARILIGRPESAQIRNLSFVGDLMMDNGGTLNCMIEYEASSKRMMVRFRKPGSIKLLDPFFSFSVDLAKLWKGGEVTVGLSSANGNSSSKAHFLHSWSFEIRHPPPMWMHSVPLEPNEVSKEEDGRGRSECIWKMLGALFFGAACGALGTMLALYIWTICRVRRSMAVVPEECAIEQGKK